MPIDKNLAYDLQKIVNVCHGQSLEAGWWTDPETGQILPPSVPTKIALIHSEISEALEADRKDLMDDKLPHRKGIEVELADAIIRIADLAGRLNLDIGGAMVEKLEYNRVREDHKMENRAKENGKKY